MDAKLYLFFLERELLARTRHDIYNLQPLPRDLSQHQMVAFSDLPADVVHTIIQVADKGTAEALSRTSKCLHQLAEPILYREITLFIDPVALFEPDHAFGGYGIISLSLRTLRSKPQLTAIDMCSKAPYSTV